MMYLEHQNVNGSVIEVTATATSLFDLINTAASTTEKDAGFKFNANGIDITAEDGDIRITWDDSSPTASKGYILKQNIPYLFRNVPLKKMKLIRVGGADVSTSVFIGACNADESSAVG